MCLLEKVKSKGLSWPPLCPGKHPCSDIWKTLLCREICNLTWCHHNCRVGGEPLSRRAQPAEPMLSPSLQKVRNTSGQLCRYCSGTARMGKAQHQDLPHPCHGCQPRAHPMLEEPTGGGYSSALCLHLLPVFTLAAAAVNFIPLCYFVERLWGDQHLRLLTALKETSMQTWNWICPYPWGTSLLMAVAVFPWASKGTFCPNPANTYWGLILQQWGILTKSMG